MRKIVDWWQHWYGINPGFVLSGAAMPGSIFLLWLNSSLTVGRILMIVFPISAGLWIWFGQTDADGESLSGQFANENRVLFGVLSLAAAVGLFVGLIAVLALLSSPNTWVVLIVGGLVYGVYWVFKTSTPAEPSVEKARPPLLFSAPVVDAVQTALEHSDGVLCGQIDGESVRCSVDDRAVVIGPPGTGKTAFMVSQLLDWAERGGSFVAIDIKPEIFGIVRDRLRAADYRLLTFNPSSRTGERYNLLDDARGAEGIGEIAAALVPPGAEENAVFSESARDLLDAMITHLRAVTGGVSLPAVRDFIGRYDQHSRLIAELAVSPDADVRDLAAGLALVGKNERLLGSVFATLRANLRFLRYPAVRESVSRSDFSLGDLCGPRVGLFLQFEERHQETTARLFSVLLGHVLRYFVEHTNRPPVALFFDEIGNAPTVAGLVKKLNTIRSRHLPTWLYWQSLEQMQPYGQKSDEGPNLILGACDLQMVFRLNDNGSADWLSAKIGTVDRLVKSVGVSSGVELSVSNTHSLVTEPVIWPHELQALARSEVVCTYHGLAWRGDARPYFEVYPEFSGVFPAPTALVGAPYAKADVITLNPRSKNEPEKSR